MSGHHTDHLDQRYREAVEECSRVIALHSKSFALASQLLPRGLRGEVAVLYAWCRRADDAIDEAPPREAEVALLKLQRELEAVYAHEETEEVRGDITLSALRIVTRRRQIPKHYPEQLLEGMRMDLEGVEYADQQSLYLYCYRVASTVGLMMCHLMGVRRESALSQAAHLGLAMQLTNICRDVSEDWGRRRLYLPKLMLQALMSSRELTSCLEAQPPPQDQRIGARFHQPELPEPLRLASQEVIASLLSEADAHYQEGYRGVDALPWRAAFAIQAAGMLYQDIGRVIRSRQCDPHQPRAFTSKPRKLTLLCAAILRVALKLTSKATGALLARLFSGDRGQRGGRLQVPQSTITFEALSDHIRRQA